MRDPWTDLRYGRLLPLAARSRRLGRAYARIAAAVELRRDPERRAVACARITRWTGQEDDAARLTYVRALRSEALEEADASYFMRRTDRLDAACRGPGPAGPAQGEVGPVCPSNALGPSIYVSLHFGSPLLLFLALRRVRRLPVAAIARPLENNEALAPAKLAYAERKVRWSDEAAGCPFLGTDAHSMLRARAQLRSGGSLYVLADVPGDRVARHTRVDMLGEIVSVAAGIESLARMGARWIRPLVMVDRGGTLCVAERPALEVAGGLTMAEVLATLVPFVAEEPGEWWLWPYVHPVVQR